MTQMVNAFGGGSVTMLNGKHFESIITTVNLKSNIYKRLVVDLEIESDNTT